MENEYEKVDIFDFWFQWLNFLKLKYLETGKFTAYYNYEFRDIFFLYCDLRNITINYIENVKKFLNFINIYDNSETFNLLRVNQKQNGIYAIYSKSNGFYKWICSKKKLFTLLYIIEVIENEHNITTKPNELYNYVNNVLAS